MENVPKEASPHDETLGLEPEMVQSQAQPSPAPPPPAPEPAPCCCGHDHDHDHGHAEVQEFITPLMRLMERGLDLGRFLRHKPWLWTRTRDLLAFVGIHAILAAGLLTFILGVVTMFQLKTVAYLAYGLTGLLLSIALHYVSARFATAGQRVLAQEAAAPGLGPLLDFLGALAALGAVASVLVGLGLAVLGKNLQFFWPWLAESLVMAVVAAFALNPKETVNLAVTEKAASPSETALAVINMVVRALLAAAPALLGLGLSVGTLWLLAEMFMNPSTREAIVRSFAKVAYFDSPFHMCAFFAVLPLMAYLLHLVHGLVVDFYLAVVKHSQKNEPCGHA